jgi:hypothetical protein
VAGRGVPLFLEVKDGTPKGRTRRFVKREADFSTALVTMRL